MMMTNLQKTQIIHLFFVVFITFFTLCLSSFHEQDPPATSPVQGHGNGNFGRLFNYDNNDNDRFFRLVASQLSSRAPTQRSINVRVDDYGAKANGGDDTEAFKKAWKVACGTSNGVLIVSNNKVYNVKPIIFQGPCKSATTIKLYGTIKASTSSSAYKKDRKHWLVFENVQNLNVEGGGTIDGNGQIWWPKSCKINKNLPCQTAPTAVTFHECNNVRVSDVTIQNAQQMHLTFQKCVNVKALNLLVVSPGNSPNTDGIHVTETQNIVIENSVIKTGDDCISIVSGSKNVRATDVKCGPGHGISIGSLGAGNSEAHVSNVFINRATFTGSTNGVRIKTWQGGSGSATNIVFENIVMNNVTNPIIIDQNYCDQKTPCHEKGSAVQVSNVLYKNIRGTSASDVAMKFDCSKRYPCRGILLQNINLKLEDAKDGKALASCSNVKFNGRFKINPSCT